MNYFKAICVITGIILFSSCSKQKTSESVFSTEALAYCEAATLANRYVVKWEDGTYSIETTSSGETDEDFRKNFVDKNLDFISHVDRDYQITLQQNSSNNTSQSNVVSWGPYNIKADALWSSGYYGQNVLVGVVDSMVDNSHIQLSHNVISVEKFNAEANDPTRNRHGTHVAGIIAANPQYGPVEGVAPSAKLVTGQFIGNSGGGSLGDAILAMNAVAAKGAKVINMSWGGAPCVQNLKSAIGDLSDKGILIVTAAGNDGLNLDVSPNYPAAFMFKNQMNVAASTIDNFLISFSNRGYKTVNIAAPGVNIISTVPNNGYESMDGTSMAAPMVSGAAALLWSAFPQATSIQIKQSLFSTVDVDYDLQVSTRGRINVLRAFQALKNILSAQ
ncbi:MAG: S8 family peptidase [Pseudobdellovibrio sp.]